MIGRVSNAECSCLNFGLMQGLSMVTILVTLPDVHNKKWVMLNLIMLKHYVGGRNGVCVRDIIYSVCKLKVFWITLFLTDFLVCYEFPTYILICIYLWSNREVLGETKQRTNKNSLWHFTLCAKLITLTLYIQLPYAV